MALLAKSQNLVDGFQAAELHSTALRNELQARNEQWQSHQTDNFTHHSGDSWQSFAYSSSDVARLDQEVKEHKSYLSNVKFSWSESNVKRRFIQHILVEDSQHDISQAQNAALEKERLASKAQLKELKLYADELRASLHDSAQALERNMHDVTPKVDKAQALNRSIRGLEVELATVRNARPAGDEVTPDEADAILEEQVNELQAQGTKLTTSKATLASLQARLAELRQDLSQLEQENVAITRQAASLPAVTADADGSLEATCKWLSMAKALLQGLLGISKIDSPSADLVHIHYPGYTLALHFDLLSFKLTNAQLLDSSERIDDLVERAIAKGGDVRLLVREVAARHWHQSAN